MNHVFSYVSALPQYFFAVKEKLIPQLTQKQKIILVIGSLAISIFAAIMIAYRCCARTSFNSPHVGGGGYRRNPTPPPSPPPVPAHQHSFKPVVSSPTPPSARFNFGAGSSPLPNPPLTQPLFGAGWQQKNQSLSVSPQSPPKPHLTQPLLGAGLQNPLGYQPFAAGNPFSDPTINPLSGSGHVTPRSDLDTLEVEMMSLQEDIAWEQQVLDLTIASKASKTTHFIVKEEESAFFVDDSEEEARLLQSNEEITEAEKKIAELQERLEECLEKYPKTLGNYLENKFKSYTDKDAHDIYERLVKLSGYMQNNATNEDFIHSCLEQVNLFLTRSFFTSKTELCLQEQAKVNLIVFHEFFSIVETHFEVINKRDPKLATDLKLKLANLPIRDDIDRAKFTNVFLTEKNQLDILMRHFQSEEDQLCATVLQKLQTRHLTAKDINKLSKMATDACSHLSPANRLKLQVALTTQMGRQAPTNWKDEHTVTHSLSQFYKRSDPYSYQYQLDSAEILNLHRASKAKEFFEQQMGFSEDQIQIPRWYHATWHNTHNTQGLYCNYVDAIIKAGRVNVEHKQAFKGAWISTQQEAGFGNSVFVFNHRIAKLDPNVFIGYENGNKLGSSEVVRWRGLQSPIPLMDPKNIPHLALMGLYRGAGKAIKSQVVQLLQTYGVIPNPKVVSVDQVSYMQKEIIKVIGNPNLTENWWGKADISHLDKPLPARQPRT